MLTFYDEKGNGYGAQVEFTTKNAVNGERSVSGTILTNEKVLSRIDRGWSFEWDGELYKIIYAKPKDEGRSLSVSFDAVHQFFYDFEHSNCYQLFNGSNRFDVYIEAIFKNSGYRYVIEAEAKAVRKENFGNASRLSMFKDIIKAAGLEFSVTGKVVRIVKKVGTDLSTVVRKNFNMNELTLEKNIGAFITYKKGLGAWKDEENHDAGRYESEYESPLARIYGRIEGSPISDERYKDTGKLLERLKKDVDNSYSISVQLEMEDLTRAGYNYKQPRAGDYIMAINETIGFREKIRIVSYESSYDVTGRLIKHKVTCNDIGTVQKAITAEGSIMRSVGQTQEYAESALEIATKALVSADGKTTTYYGAEKPRDQPQGTLHRGDMLYLTVGEETELYFWNGAEWELKNLKFDSSKLEKMFADSKASTDKAIAEAKKQADEALKKAGTIANSESLSAKIKEEILKSKDLSDKINRTFVESNNGTEIYNKIAGEVSKKFVTVDVNDARYRDLTSRMDSTDQTITRTSNRIGEVDKNLNKTIINVNDKIGEFNNRLNKTTIDVVNAQGTADNVKNQVIITNQKVSEIDQSVAQANGRIDQTNSNLEATNAQVEANKRQIEVQVTNYNAVRESTKLYERILGTSETGAPDKLSRLVMSSEIFQTEVGKYVTDDNNLIVNSMTLDKNTIVQGTTPGVRVSLEDRTFSIYAYDLTSRNYTGFSLPIYVKKVYRGETYTLGFKYRFRYYPDEGFAFNIKNHGRNKILSARTVGDNRPPLNEWQEYQQTFTINDDFEFGEDRHFPFYVYLVKNGWVEFKEPILVRGSKTGPYKPSQFDDAYKSLEETKKTTEAVRTQMTLLSNSWSVKALNGPGDVLGSINLNPDGSVRINEGLLSIGEKTIIKNGVIKDGMIENLSANKVNFGTLNGNDVNVINLNAKSITSGTFRGLTFEGGIIRGNNGNTEINLNTNTTTYNGTAKIEFRSPYNSLEFNSGGRKAFLAPTIASGTNNAAFAFGVNDRGEGNPNNNFVGFKIFNSYGNRRIYMIGDIYIVANSVSDNAPSVSLNTILNRINDNFKMLREFRNRYNEGSPGFWDVGVY